VVLVLHILPSVRATVVDPSPLVEAKAAAVSFVTGLPERHRPGMGDVHEGQPRWTPRRPPAIGWSPTGFGGWRLYYSTATGDALAAALVSIRQFSD
jgi:hypothetical protein